MCQNSEKMIQRNLRPTVLAVLSLIGASCASALVLESPSGGAVLGSPIEFNLRATLAAGEDASTLCLQADVLQADALVPPSKVRLLLLNGSSSSQATVRITSAVVVEEPVLNLVVRSGCSQKNVRKFVIFADPPMAGVPLVGAAASSLASTVRSQQVPQQLESGSSVVGERSGRFASSDTGASKARPAPKDNQKSVIHSVSEASRPNANALSRPEKPLQRSQRLAAEKTLNSPLARLQLDIVGSAIDPVTKLKSSFELTTLPSENSPQRSEAADLWRVLSSTSEELQQDLQRSKILQGETVALKNASVQTGIDSVRMAERLKAAEDQQYKNPLVYSLAALLAFAVLALFKLRSSNGIASPTWWNTGREKNETEPSGKPAATLDLAFGKSRACREPADPSVVKTVAALAGRRNRNVVAKVGDSRSDESLFGPLGYQASTRDVNVEELFDIQQQADFFISLGQHDQAVQVLKNHINENAQTSPLVYLDLLSLYHSKERANEYRDLAAEFTRLFNGVVPAFEAFEEKTPGLEAYSTLLSRIESLWHTDDVIVVIEDSVFRNDSGASETLDLEAYRELLLLHSVAKDFAEGPAVDIDAGFKRDEGSATTTTEVDSMPFVDIAGGLHTGLKLMMANLSQPKPARRDEELISVENRADLFQKPVGARIGLDIDLSTYPQEPIVPVLSQSDTHSAALKSDHSTAPTRNVGVIEFNVEAVDAEFGKIKRKAKS